MTESSADPTTVDDFGLAWRTFAGERVKVHALAGSYPARLGESELRHAERIVAELEKLLEPPRERRGGIVRIYLVDPAGELPTQRSTATDDRDGYGTLSNTVGDEAIVRVVQPETPSEPIAWPLTRMLIKRWFGPPAASAMVIVDGVAGVVAARTETGPTVRECEERVDAQLAEGDTMAIVAGQVAADTGSATAVANQYAATAFAAYLLEAFGTGSLRQFLLEFDPERRDHAAMTAYQRPLGTLVEMWLANSRRHQAKLSPVRAFFRHIAPLLRPYWRHELEVGGYMLFELAFGVILPLSSKYLIDTVIPSGSLRMLGLFILILSALFVLDAVVGLRRSYLISSINDRIVLGLQERMFAHLQRLPHAYYGSAKVGDLMSRLSGDLQLIERVLSQVVGGGVFVALQAVAAAIAIFVLSPLLGALVLAVVPLFAVGYVVLRERLRRASYELQKLLGEVATAAQENLAAHAVIKAFGLEQRAIASYHARLMAVLGMSLRLSLIGALFQTSVGLATTLGQLLVLGVGSYLVLEGQLTIGTLIAFAGLLPSLFVPIATLSDAGQSVDRASGALERVSELLDEPVTIADRPNAVPLQPLTQEIRLDRVTFGYEPGRPILRDLDLVIPAGSNVAIIGRSGCGKSSVINLVLRFWDPEQGRVLFDDLDVRDISLASLRAQIGLVLQDTVVFDTTIRDNIAIGRPSATDAEVGAAAQAARLDDYITSLPSGFDTVLGERGVRMSGGQRQRLAIARALVRDPRILILDEATSALDSQTEREIQETLRSAARGRTTISVTHRLTSAATADRIFVLDDGRLVEAGTHAELMAAAGLYHRLYEEQTSPALRAGPRRAKIEATQLRAIPLFANLRTESLGLLTEELMLERYGGGEDVVRQGEYGDRMYLIQHGQVEVVVADDGGERRINTLADGDYFGEMALLSGGPRMATVRTTMPSEMYSLGHAEFVSLLEQEPAFQQEMLETLARRRSALAVAGAVAAGVAPADAS
jgi:ATP-binding cassette, subfamily B, bacterial